MEVTIGGMRQAQDTVQSSHISASEQQKNTGEETVKQQEKTYDTVSPHGDTLSVSEEGKAQSARMNNLSGDKETADGIVIRKEAEGNTQEQEEGITQEQEDELSTINLSTYTESELRQMYFDGDITRYEYDEEISSREMEG